MIFCNEVAACFCLAWLLGDQRFASGDQWPDDVKALRVGRPMQTINRLPAFIDQIIGDARQNKVAIKVFAGEDGDVDVIVLLYDDEED